MQFLFGEQLPKQLITTHKLLVKIIIGKTLRFPIDQLYLESGPARIRQLFTISMRKMVYKTNK